MVSKFLLLNSFDRSGSTLISKALEQHPKVENLFNPFNATVFRRKFMDVWPSPESAESEIEGKRLLSLLLKGDFKNPSFKSKVYLEHSSTFELKESLYIMKTTNFQMKTSWFIQEYPVIPYYALIRNPLDILTSLVRNDFHTQWYGGWAYKELVSCVQNNPAFNIPLNLLKLEDEIEQMAAIIGVLNNEMLKCLPQSNIIKYEDIIQDPNKELNLLLEKYNFSKFDFSSSFSNSVNSSGKAFDGKRHSKEIFSSKQIEKYISIFKSAGNQGYVLK